jgi:hypothetical protein
MLASSLRSDAPATEIIGKNFLASAFALRLSGVRLLHSMPKCRRSLIFLY